MLTVIELMHQLQTAVANGVPIHSPVKLVIYDGMDPLEHALVDHVDVKCHIAGTDMDGVEISGDSFLK